MPNIIYTIDVDGIFTFVNNSIRILGYDPKELIGYHFVTKGGIHLLHSDDVELFSRHAFFNKQKNIKIEGGINMSITV